MSSHLVSTLTTVNAPYSTQLNEEDLVMCLLDLTVAKAYSGHVSSFFGEVPIKDQLEFAHAYRISVESLQALAKKFGNWSGESYPLAA